MFLMLERAESLRLDGEEIQAIGRCINRLEAETLYHASARGWRAYRDFRQRLGDAARIRPKAVLRALLRTVWRER